MNAFAKDKINVVQSADDDFDQSRKHSGKRKKCLLSVFSPFPTKFSQMFLPEGL